MKKLFMLCLFVTLFFFCQSALAYDYGMLPQSLPYVRGTHTYDNVIVGKDATYNLPFACYIAIGQTVAYTKSYSGGYLYPSTSWGGGGNTYCYIKEGNTTWVGGYAGVGVLVKVPGSCPALSTTVDIYYTGVTYNYGFNYCNLGTVSNGQKIFTKDIFDYDQPLAIIIDPAESGAVTSDPTGINCRHFLPS